MKGNWIQRYDKAGMVLRIQTVINNPEEFKVRRKVIRSRRRVTEWVPMRKGVHSLFRYRDVSLSANSRYLDALSIVSDPTARVAEVDRITRRKRSPSGRTARAFNPLSREDLKLFQSVMGGNHCIRGFANREIRNALAKTVHVPSREAAEERASRFFTKQRPLTRSISGRRRPRSTSRRPGRETGRRV